MTSGTPAGARHWFRALASLLREGRGADGRFEWLRPETIDGLRLDERPGRPRIVVHVAARWPLGIVPRRLETPAGRIDLVPRRAARPRLQCANLYVDLLSGIARVRGTAGFLANDAFAPESCLLVTAGHVLGSNAAAAFDDPVTIEAQESGVRIERAFVAENAAPFSGAPVDATVGPYPLDAGLVRLRPDDWRKLIDKLPSIVPADTAGLPAVQAPLRAMLPGARTVEGLQWHEEALTMVDVEQVWPDGMKGVVHLRIDTLRSWKVDTPTEDGDSGAPIRDGNDALVGIHCGYRDTDDEETGNAFYTPVQPILDHFDIVALTQASRNAPLPARPRPALGAALARPAVDPPPAPAAPPRPTDEEAVDTLARTLWAEARGEGDDGMKAVACVVLNRVAAPCWWGRTIVDVCRKPFQFSCWNEGTSSRAQLLRVSSADQAFAQALAIARQAVASGLKDFTRGAMHYHAIEVLPKWARGKAPCFRLGRHVFYNDI